MRFLLDTDIASYAIKGNSKVLNQMHRHLMNWTISAITFHELSEGLIRAKNPQVEELIAEFLKDVDVVDFSKDAALESGRLAAILANAGNPIGELDTLIAGHALSLNLTLVTNNEKHFSKVPELRTTNWAA